MSSLFDDISRVIASPVSRREAVRLIGGAAGGALLTALGFSKAAAWQGDSSEWHCEKGLTVCGKSCCKSNQVCCKGQCCNPGQECKDGRCCNHGEVNCNGVCCAGCCCAGKCCASPKAVCLNSVCCDSGVVCAGKCCAEKEFCVDGKCKKVISPTKP